VWYTSRKRTYLIENSYRHLRTKKGGILYPMDNLFALRRFENGKGGLHCPHPRGGFLVEGAHTKLSFANAIAKVVTNRKGRKKSALRKTRSTRWIKEGLVLRG